MRRQTLIDGGIMKKIKIILFSAIMIFVCSNTVLANEMIKITNNDAVRIINNNGLNITESAYKKLQFYGFTDTEILNLDLEAYNTINEINADMFSKEEKYYKDTYVYKSLEDYNNKNKPTRVVTEEITQEEYSNLSTTDLINHNGSTYETSARKLVLVISYFSDKPAEKNISLQTTFKTIPSVRSYDIIAMRVTNGEITSNSQSINTEMTYKVPTAACDGIYTTQTSTATATHTSNGWNKKNFTLGYYGIGFTGLLPNDYINCYNDLSFPFYQTLTGYKITMFAKARSIGNTITAYGTYQHATSNVNFSDVVRSYDFTSSGLGGVVSFTNGMASRYDGGGGTSLTY